MDYLMTILAMGTPPAGGQGGQGGQGGLMLFGYMIIIFALFYFLMIRPQTKKEKERKKMIEAIKSGDRIIFSNGILGTVANVKDQTLIVKIADNVKIEVVRGAALRVLQKDEDPGELDKTA